MKIYVSHHHSTPTVILLHGYLADHHYWDPLLSSLTSDATVVTADLLGFGASHKPKAPSAYSFRHQAEVLHQRLHEANIPPPYIVAGHSMGALIAATFAANYAAEVFHAVLVNPPVFPSKQHAQQELAATGFLYNTLLYRSGGRVLWPLVITCLPLLRLRNQELRSMSARHSDAARRGALRAIETTDIRPVLARLTVPTDIIMAFNDRPTYRQALDDLALPKTVTVHNVTTGHHTPLEQPAVVTELLRAAIYG